VHRDDGELVGFVRESGGRWRAETVFGAALDEHADRDDAECALTDRGLSYLAEKWLLEDDGSSLTVEIVEAGPDQVTVQIVDFETDDTYGRRVVLSAPVDGRLRLRR